jgi:hypothetical protein
VAEGDKLAGEAYLIIRAKDGGIHDDIKRSGDPAAERAGKSAGEKWSDGFTRTADGKLKDHRGRLVRDSERAGDEAGRKGGDRYADRFRDASRRASKGLESDLVKGIDKGLKRSLIGAVAVGGLASTFAATGTVIAGTAGAVVSLSGALGALPAAGAAAVTVTQALKVGLLGVGDAIKNSGDPKAYAEAVKGLSGEAREFTDTIRVLRPEFGKFQDSVQDNLFDGLAESAARLTGRYLPILERQFGAIADEANRGAKDVAAFLSAPTQARSAERFFASTADAAKGLASALKPAAGAFLDLAEVGARFLPAGAERLAGAAERFAETVARAKASGALEGWIRDGLDAVGDLGSALQGVGRIFTGILSAGGGANTSGLESFAALLNRAADAIERPAFQSGLSSVFNAIGAASDAIGASLPQVADGLAALAPGIASLTRGAGVALGDLLEQAGRAAENLAPTLNAVAAGLEHVAPFAGEAVAAFLLFKGALLGVKAASTVVNVLDKVNGGLIQVTGSAGKAGTAMRGLAVGGAVVGGLLAIGAAINAIAPNAEDTAVKLGAMSLALDRFGNGRSTGALNTLGKDFSELGAQLDELASPGAARRFEDFMGVVFSWAGGSTKGGEPRRALLADLSSLDQSLTQLVQGGQTDQAAALFQKLNSEAVAGGAGVLQLAQHLPTYSDAVAAAAAESGGAVTSVEDLARGIRGQGDSAVTTASSMTALATATSDYAGTTVEGNATARTYEEALDRVREAARRNGKTLDITTEKGRENSAALDAIATSGIALARFQAGEGAGAQTKFREGLVKVRGDLIAAGIRLGLTKKEAREYANQLVKIPKKASTSVTTPGLKAADRAARSYRDAIDRIPKTVTVVFRGISGGTFDPRVRYSDGKPILRASGGVIPTGIGTPGVDSVPALLTPGEFVVRAPVAQQTGMRQVLDAINSGRAARFASGGPVGGGPPGTAAAGWGRMHPDDLRLLGQVIGQAVARATRNQSITVDGRHLATVVDRQMGQSL